MSAIPRPRRPVRGAGGRQVPLSVMVTVIWSSTTVACNRMKPCSGCAAKACSAALASASYTARVRPFAASSSTQAPTQRRKVRRSAVALCTVAEVVTSNGCGGSGKGEPERRGSGPPDGRVMVLGYPEIHWANPSPWEAKDAKGKESETSVTAGERREVYSRVRWGN